MLAIKPFTGVGNLLFADARTEIRNKVNGNFEPVVKKFGAVGENYDYFPLAGFFVYYNQHGYVNAFEFFDSKPQFNEMDLLSMPYKQLVTLFFEFDNELQIEYNGFTSNKYGIGGGTNDDPDDDKAMPESIIVFRKGYYNILR